MADEARETGAQAPVTQTNETHEDPLRAAVAAAFDNAEKKSAAEPKPGEKPAAPAAKPAAGAVVVVKDPRTGRFTKSGDAARAAPKDQVAVTAAPAPAAAAAPAVEPKPGESKPGESKPGEKPAESKPGEEAPVRVDRAPQSWKPEARALWAKLPPEFAPVKAEVVRLERERETVLRESAGARQLSAAFAEVVRPYEGFIRAAGHTPMQSVSELMRTAAALRTLPEWDRAVLVAGIARAHGVNPEYLFAALTNQGPLPGAAAAPQPQEFRDPRVDELLEQAGAARESAEAAADQAADEELDDFIGRNPLADDPEVQARMARAIDLAKASDGVDITYEEAYAGVLAVDPELRAIAEQQAQATTTNPDGGSTARAEAAASSLKPSPVTLAPQTLKGKSLEQHVAAAYDKATTRA